ncbi:hypothetical protein [Streptomyces sp. NBC_01506]
MAEDPIDLIRLEGDGNSVVLRIAGKDERKRPTEAEAEALVRETWPMAED